jgi:ABC-type protease/lipase transport system fused ATPase/permease subunit
MEYTLPAIYYVPAPPYCLVLIAALMGLACGKAFEVSLKQKADNWAKRRSPQPLSDVQELRLILPFAGICICSWIFLGSALTIFAVTWALGFSVAFLVVMSSAVLVWSQLTKLMKTLEEGGSEALEITSIF